MSVNRQWSLALILLLFTGVANADLQHTTAKPQAPLAFDYKLQPLSAQNQQRLSLTVINHVDAEQLRVEVRGSDGVQFANLQSPYYFGVMPSEQGSVIEIDMSATGGRSRVYVMATLHYAGKIQSSSHVIPLITENSSAAAVLHKPAGRIQQDATGRNIISMPGKAVNAAQQP